MVSLIIRSPDRTTTFPRLLTTRATSQFDLSSGLSTVAGAPLRARSRPPPRSATGRNIPAISESLATAASSEPHDDRFGLGEEFTAVGATLTSNARVFDTAEGCAQVPD